MEINLQLIEKVDRQTTDGSLEVISVWNTIQGEGPFAGIPAIFVRLAGCTLQCRYCDTQYTQGRERRSVEDLVNQILEIDPRTDYLIPRDYSDSIMEAAFKHHNLVVLSGGEPLRQNVAQLCNALNNVGYMVQIETNGTLPFSGWQYLPDDSPVSIVVSPKAQRVHEELLTCPYIACFKYILQHGAVSKKDGLPTTVLGDRHNPARPPEGFPRNSIFVQPLDEQDETKNFRNVQAAVHSCMEYGYRLSLQTHKYLGLE